MNVTLYDIDTGTTVSGNFQPMDLQIGAFLNSGGAMHGRPHHRLFRVVSILTGELGGFPTVFVKEHHIERTGKSLDHDWVCTNIARTLRNERRNQQP